MPVTEPDLRRLGRAMGHRTKPAEAVVADRQASAREVRRLHERLFYRPLLAAAAKLGPSDVRLSPDAARQRLLALGFRDPAGALRHIEALTTGVSRRAAIQRTLLPVMLGWFADEADPDAGLLSFRRVSDELGSTHWYLKMLRDEGRAAERLAHALARSRYAADLLARSPESVSMLGDPNGLTPRTREALVRRCESAAGRRDTVAEAIAAVRTIRRHELLRVTLADLLGTIDLRGVGSGPDRPHGSDDRGGTRRRHRRRGAARGATPRWRGARRRDGQPRWRRARLRLRRRRALRAPAAPGRARG